MLKTTTIILLSLLSTAPALASDPATDYRAMRDALFAANAYPLAEYATRDHCDATTQSVCADFPEAYRCAGTGLNPCEMRWRLANGVELTVFTIGENYQVTEIHEGRP